MKRCANCDHSIERKGRGWVHCDTGLRWCGVAAAGKAATPPRIAS